MIHSLYPVTIFALVFLNNKKIHLTIKINVLFTHTSLRGRFAPMF